MRKLLIIFFSLGVISNIFSQFITQTNYKGAFEPFPSIPWTEGWVNWDPQNTQYIKSDKQTVSISSDITTNTTWTSNNIYLLTNFIHVKNNATLTIEPGTIILGDKNYAGASLIITRGAKLMAEGTVDSPIVFTSNQDAGNRSSGDWGGLILLGNAKNNTVGGFGNVEGITPSEDTKYGGSDDDDNSGSLKYVRVEFAGYPLQPNKEINGITFGSIGRGTKIDYLQVSFSNDDSYEWFGGTVNCKHLIAYRGLDDDFDTDNGFSGTVQFGLGVRDPQIADNPAVSTSEGFESDNDPAGDASTPLTTATFTNMTMVGPLRGDINATVANGYRRAARIRRNSNLKITNSILIDFLTGLSIEGTACESNAKNNTLQFKGNILAGYRPSKVGETNSTISSSIDIKKFIGDNNDTTHANSSANILKRPYDYLNPDYRPFTTDCFNVSIVPKDSTKFCQGGFVILNASAAVSTPTYQWYLNDQAIINATQNTYKATTAGKYTVKLVDGSCEVISLPIEVIVNPLPTATISPSGNVSTICDGSTLTLVADGGVSYKWNTGSTENKITVTKAGPYYADVINQFGCKSVVWQDVIVDTVLLVTINNLKQLVFKNESAIQLEGTPKGGVFTGEGVSGDTFNPEKATLGKKVITYSYSTSNGCKGAAKGTVIIVDSLGNVCNSTKYDTLKVTKFDTVTVTNNVTKYDTVTVKNNVYDTVTITNNVTKYDTVIVNKTKYDTVIVKTNVFDTVKVTKYDTLTVTNNVTKYDTVKVTKYDTLTIKNNIYDTVSILKIKFKLTTGVHANQLSSLSIYPNPTSDVLHIEVPDAKVLEGYRYRILDALGKEVYNQLVTQSTTEIPLKTLGAAGIYQFEILDATKTSIQSNKIVLQ